MQVERFEDIVRELRALTQPLTYVSETDARFEVLRFAGEEPSSRADVKRLLGIKSALREYSFDQFFTQLTAERPWHTRHDADRANNFRRLREYLEANLTNLIIYRTGRVRIDIFIVGIFAGGGTIVLKTNAVET